MIEFTQVVDKHATKYEAVAYVMPLGESWEVTYIRVTDNRLIFKHTFDDPTADTGIVLELRVLKAISAYFIARRAWDLKRRLAKRKAK